MSRTLSLLVSLLLLVGCDPAHSTSTAGATVPAGTPLTLMIHPAAAQSAGPAWTGHAWELGTSTAPLRYPVQVQTGDVLVEWTVFFRRDALGPATTVRLQRLETVSGLHFDVGPAVTDAEQGPGYVAIGAHIPPETVNDDHTYSLLVEGGGVAGDRAASATVFGIRP